MAGFGTDIFLVRQTGGPAVSWLRAPNAYVASETVARTWAETFGEPLPKDLTVLPGTDRDVDVPELREWILRLALERFAPDELNANARYVIAFREDSSGDPSVYVTVVLRDDAAPRLWPQRAALGPTIRDIVQRTAPGVWPYIGFSAEDEGLNPENPPA